MIVNPIWPRAQFWIQNLCRHFGCRICAVTVPEVEIQKGYFVLNVGHLVKRQGQLHSVPLHSDSCTRVRLARGRRTYARASDVCTRAGLMFRRRTYARAPDFGTGAGLMYRRRSCAPAPVLCTGRRTYAEAPDLCRGAGLKLMRGRRTYA